MICVSLRGFIPFRGGSPGSMGTHLLHIRIGNKKFELAKLFYTQVINCNICLRLQFANLFASSENLSAPALSKNISSKDSETQVIFVFLQRECSAKLFFFFFAPPLGKMYIGVMMYGVPLENLNSQESNWLDGADQKCCLCS